MTPATKKAAPRPVSLRGCLTTDRTLVLPPRKVDRIAHLAIHGNGRVGVEACENPARAHYQCWNEIAQKRRLKLHTGRS